MATKTALMDGDGQRKKQGPKFYDGVVGRWIEFTSFLSDVRAEMRKVVARTSLYEGDHRGSHCRRDALRCVLLFGGLDLQSRRKQLARQAGWASIAVWKREQNGR